MGLTISVVEKETGVYTFVLEGSIDSQTSGELEHAVETIFDSSTKALVFDMTGVSYISSMGLRVIFMTKERIETQNGTLIIANVQPKIKEMFDIVKVIPPSMFASLDEADEYLDAFLSQIEQQD